MQTKAHIFDIKRDCSEDGPGIRTTVFFKGCPLSCVWCQNPEGMDKNMELSYSAKNCVPSQCHATCISTCKKRCLHLNMSGIDINRIDCTVCGQCTEVCPTKALQMSSYWIEPNELLYRLLIDKPFFLSSGGGVTLSGGEVTLQMGAAHQLLKALKAEGVQTTIETCGFFNFRRFQQSLLPWLDIIYFDIKLIDENEALLYTGQSNGLILENFLKLHKMATIPVIPRVPLIPGITTSQKNLEGIANFLHRNGVDEATLLSYNPLWGDKAVKLGKNRDYHQSKFMTPRETEQSVSWFRPSA